MENSQQQIRPDGPESRRLAAELIKAGGIVAYRTDTFYGLGTDPFNVDALRALNELKGRDGKPILLLIADESDAKRLLLDGGSELFRALAARFWPGPLTLVARAGANLPDLLTAGTGTVGVRFPDDEAAREIVRVCGGALTATSANPSGRPPARNAFEVADYFKDTLCLVLDGGEARTLHPSTVLDVSGTTPRLIREGVVSRAELEEALGRIGLPLE
ncbi:MAG: threonylcarbamoyl-AMP synthase [Acidobacteria bacterium]|nr:threonylcarbamoyl-AMP synthase [Acidobacteriota bacterium]